MKIPMLRWEVEERVAAARGIGCGRISYVESAGSIYGDDEFISLAQGAGVRSSCGARSEFSAQGRSARSGL